MKTDVTIYKWWVHDEAWSSILRQLHIDANKPEHQKFNALLLQVENNVLHRVPNDCRPCPEKAHTHMKPVVIDTKQKLQLEELT